MKKVILTCDQCKKEIKNELYIAIHVKKYTYWKFEWGEMPVRLNTAISHLCNHICLHEFSTALVNESKEIKEDVL